MLLQNPEDEDVDTDSQEEMVQRTRTLRMKSRQDTSQFSLLRCFRGTAVADSGIIVLHTSKRPFDFRRRRLEGVEGRDGGVATGWYVVDMHLTFGLGVNFVRSKMRDQTMLHGCRKKKGLVFSTKVSSSESP